MTAGRGLFRIYDSCMFVSSSFLYYYYYYVGILSSETNAFKSFFSTRCCFEITFRRYIFISIQQRRVKGKCLFHLCPGTIKIFDLTIKMDGIIEQNAF